MIVFFGKGAVKVATHTVATDCVSCGATDNLVMNVYQKYNRIFFIPAFPAGRTATMTCSNCGTTDQEKYFPTPYKLEFFRLMHFGKKPWWIYSGLILLGAFFIAGMIGSYIDDVHDGEMIAAPRKGDVYHILLKSSDYTLYRVERVEGGTAYLQSSEYVTDDESGISNLYEKPFTKESYPIDTATLKEMSELGIIIEVEREE